MPNIIRVGGGVAFSFPEYDGTHAFYGDQRKGYMIIGSSGTLTATSDMTVDIFLVGGGGGGNHSGVGSGGGGGGYTKNIYGRSIVRGSEVAITIGEGGTATTASNSFGGAGGFSQFGDAEFDKALGAIPATSSYYIGGDGGSGGGSGGRTDGAAGDGGADGSSGQYGYAGTGQGTTTKAFEGDVAPFDGMLYSGGGGGGAPSDGGAAGKGGAGGGADATKDALPNTGGGGGAHGGKGGSGICIIRWGY